MFTYLGQKIVRVQSFFSHHHHQLIQWLRWKHLQQPPMEYPPSACRQCTSLPQAASLGHMGCLRALYQAHRPAAAWELAVVHAVQSGHSGCLRYLIDQRQQHIPPASMCYLVSDAHVDDLRYVFETSHVRPHLWLSSAVMDGRLDAVRMMHEDLGAPFDEHTIVTALMWNQVHLLDYLKAAGAPRAHVLTFLHSMYADSIDRFVLGLQHGCCSYDISSLRSSEIDSEVVELCLQKLTSDHLLAHSELRLAVQGIARLSGSLELLAEVEDALVDCTGLPRDVARYAIVGFL